MWSIQALTSTYNVLVMDLQVVLGDGELNPDSSFTCIDRLSNLNVIANFADALVGSSSFVEHGVIAIV
jgi:hypothetical protein